MNKPTVLVIDDNAPLRDAIRETLEDDGYAVFTASHAQEALSVLKVKRTDTILLDLMLPDANGLTLIAKIREQTDAPVIVISGKGALVDKVVGLEMGADDYLGKPFEMKELSARVKASIRRYKGAGGKAKGGDAPRRVRFGTHILDGAKFQVYDAAGTSCDLTTMEFRLLEALVAANNQVLTREQLLDKARADNLNVSDRAIDIQIARIRKKIGDDSKDPTIIKTIRGVGYMLTCDPEELD
ncbi:MAG: response regulator transcription factor [Micavibrio sp.]|nr:response regulator transcription factor [Micavibrio sp.]